MTSRLSSRQPGTLHPEKSNTTAPQQPDAPSPRPRVIALPSPEKLGIGTGIPLVNPRPGIPSPTTAPGPNHQARPFDWTRLGQRLKELDASSFRMDRMSDSRVRVTLVLPGATPAAPRHVEAIANSESAAVNLALEKAESSYR